MLGYEHPEPSAVWGLMPLCQSSLGGAANQGLNQGSKMQRIALTDPAYPQRVKTIMGARAPRHLDIVGNLGILQEPGVGFSGSRQATTKGLGLAQQYAKQTAERGFAVVSGNANGIDATAHFTSLNYGGTTILVLPQGINHFFVRKDLEKVWDWHRVLVISQFDADDSWRGWRAMERNKLIVALSRAVIVFEPGYKGGTFDAGVQTLKAGVPLFIAKSTPRPGDPILRKQGARWLPTYPEFPDN